MPWQNTIDLLIDTLQIRSLTFSSSVSTHNIYELLRQALTRQKAIEEKMPDAASKNYQELEFLGDAVLTLAIRQLILARKDPSYTLEEITHCTEILIGNTTILPKVAQNLNIARFIIKGRSELEVTSKMQSDAVEAILGAIATVSSDKAMQTVERLWSPYLTFAYLRQLVTTKRTDTLKSNPPPPVPAAAALVNPVRPKNTPAAESRLRSEANNPVVNISKFELYIDGLSDLDFRASGRLGDTVLMMLLRKPKLRPEKEIPRIEALLKRGASWTATNNLGENADTLAHNHPQPLITKLKSINFPETSRAGSTLPAPAIITASIPALHLVSTPVTAQPLPLATAPTAVSANAALMMYSYNPARASASLAIPRITMTASSKSSSDDLKRLTPRSQQAFSASGKKMSLQKFINTCSHITNLEVQNVGNKGLTLLMSLLSKSDLATNPVQQEKVQHLLRLGASWTTQSRTGTTAEDFARIHPPEMIARFKSIRPVK